VNRFTVEVTDSALSAIAEQARYIAVDAQAPLNARRWLERIRDAVDSLERWPLRAALAEESALLDFEVRQLVVGKHLLLFTVDAHRSTIMVIGLRHGHRLPRPGDLLPDDDAPAGGEED